MSKNPLISLTEKIDSAKPSMMEPEKKEKVLRNIKRTLVAATIALPTAAVITLVKYYSEIPAIENENED